VTAFVRDLLTPLIAIPGKSVNFESLSFTIRNSHFLYGDVINFAISFLLIAAAIFFLVVRPITSLQERRSRGKDEEVPTTRQCPECLSDIPLAATRCAYCTAPVEPVVDKPEPAGL
jgi:large conductance mechanosensitive channel